MATTTNYGWTTPDDTALVKDGASAIRTLGSSIDTSVKALSPGTTAGDIDYYTSGTAKARLGIGSSGQILTVSSGVPSWATAPAAGSMTLLSTTTLSGASTTISSINQTYKNLVVFMFNATNDTGNGQPSIKPNNVSSPNIQAVGSSNWNGAMTTEIYTSLSQSAGNNILRTTATNIFYMTIFDYASTTRYKPFQFESTWVNTGSTIAGTRMGGAITTNSAISSLVFSNSGGSYSAGTVLIYGVN